MLRGVAELLARIKAAARAPTADERRLDIVDLHEARPGITERTLGAWTTAQGKTGYELLVDYVPRDAGAVLELGAGNGPLLESLQRGRPDLTRIVGVDLCAADLELARQRLGEGVELRRERADRVGLADASVDAVLTHHAFYLFEPTEAVIAQIARVLRPGSVFATAHWSFSGGDDACATELMNVFGPLTRRDAPHFTGWGDRRLFNAADLQGLLAAGGLSDGFTIEEYTFAIAEPAATVCDRLMGFFYSVELQRPETQQELRSQWLRVLEKTDVGDGLARLSFPFSIVSVRKAE